MRGVKGALGVAVLVLFFNCKVYSKTYYFNVNKTSNEYMVRTRYDPNHQQTVTQLQLSELRNNVSRNKHYFEVQTHPLLDPEWDYDWKNLTRSKIPPYINKYFEMVSKNLTGTVRFLFNVKPPNSTIFQCSLKTDLKGNVSEIELHFYHKVQEKQLKNSLILRLYQIENNFVNESSLINPDAHKLLNVIYVYKAQSGWQIFKLRNNLLNWFENNTDLMLFITVSRPNEEQFDLLKDFSKDASQTFMILRTEEAENEHPRKNDSSGQTQSCRRRNLYVDFAKLNWMKFIIAPSGYDAFACFGSCHTRENQPNHLKVTSFSQEMARKPLCCAPKEYSSLPIMFYDKTGNVAIKVYDKMVVSACSCR